MSRRPLVFLLVTIFVIEFAVMRMFEPLLSNLNPLFAGLKDSIILTLLFAPPLWILCSQIYGVHPAKFTENKLLTKRVEMFCFLLVAVSTVEFAVMFILQTFLPGLFGNKLALVDASLTALCILPFAKIFFARFGDRLHAPAPTDLIASPVILYSAILYMVFVADAIQESFQPLLIPKGFEDYFLLVDSTLTTLIVAPFIWIMVGRPLIKGVRDEKIRTETILDQVVEAVIALDSNGKILSMNPPAERIFGYKSLELAGRAITEIFSEQPLDMEQLIDDFSDSKSGQKGVIFRNRTCRHRNGALIFLDISVSSVQQHGRKELLLILHDITQYKETERALRERDERFQQIFEQADDAIAFFQPKTCKYIDVNETFAKLFGFTKAEIIKLELENLIAPSDIDMVKQAIMQTVRGRPRNINNLRGLRSNGGQFNLSMRSKLLTVDNIDIVQCSFRDITDRIRLEMEAKEIQTKLIQTNKMTSLGLMVSGVAHEINNPNNFILNNSRILEKSWDDISKILHEYYLEHGDYSLGGIPFTEVGEHFPKLLSGISDGSTRIAKIIYNLKNFYRPINVREDNLDINRVVSSAVSLLQHELVKHTKKFEIKLSEKSPTVSGNAQQLGQVVINLILNACQALPGNNCGVSVETDYDPETSQVVVTVTDEGRGMTPEESNKIMEPFFTTKLDEGGTGLGLTICRSIVMEHGGTLEFESSPGKGTRFQVKLPAILAESKD